LLQKGEKKVVHRSNPAQKELQKVHKKKALPPGFEDIETTKNKDQMEIITIILDKQVPYDVFLEVMEFLYTGLISRTKDVRDILSVAELFKLRSLVDICNNILENNEYLNPSIGTYLNDEAGARAIDLFFFNKIQYSDIIFQLSDGSIFLCAQISRECSLQNDVFYL